MIDMPKQPEMVRRGFKFSHETRWWVNGDFAITVPVLSEKLPTEAGYSGRLWLSLWNGVPIGSDMSLDDAIDRLEAGYLPVGEEESQDVDSSPVKQIFEARCPSCKVRRQISLEGVVDIEVGEKGGGWRKRGFGKCVVCGSSASRFVPAGTTVQFATAGTVANKR